MVYSASEDEVQQLKLPFLFVERGYFLDIKYFFRNTDLSGFKVLCGSCNLRCYYCHRIPHFEQACSISVAGIVKEMNKWEPYNIVTLTGGEITLFPRQASFLMDYLHRQNKYVVFSTNATNKFEISQLVSHSDVVKIDLKASRRHMQYVCGFEYYDEALGSISACSSSGRATEVKVLIHDFTTEEDIKSELIDLERATRYPKNMIIEFQLIHDFMKQGIGVQSGDKYREVCRNLSPLPDVVLFKEYSEVETIEILEGQKWSLFAKKDIPLIIKEGKILSEGNTHIHQDKNPR